jgi:O-antigen/teichoic acid export membrane protein
MADELLLRWNAFCDFLERRTRVDIRYLFKGATSAVVAQVIESLTILALSMIISRYVAKDAYGTYKFILSLAAILGALSLNDLASAVFQSTARGFDGALPAGVRASIKWSSGIFLGAFVLATYYFAHDNLLVGFGILVAGCGAPLTISVNLFRAFLGGKQDFARQAWYGGILPIVCSSGALAITALVAPTPIALVIVYTISNLAVAIYSYYRIASVYKPSQENADPDMMRYAKHMSVIGVLATIAGNIDQVLLFHFGGTVNLAVYNFAVGVIDQTKGPLKTLDSMLQARFATRSRSDIDTNIGNKMKWLAFLSVAIIVVYIPMAPYLYRILFPAYTESILVSQIYVFALLGQIFTPALSYLSAKKKVRELYIFWFSSNLFQIAVMAIGVIYWGLWGLVVSRIIARLFAGTVAFTLYRTSQES